jgi:hypothetical protein
MWLDEIQDSLLTFAKPQTAITKET